jgi:hypothetical protein
MNGKLMKKAPILLLLILLASFNSQAERVGHLVKGEYSDPNLMRHILREKMGNLEDMDCIRDFVTSPFYISTLSVYGKLTKIVIKAHPKDETYEIGFEFGSPLQAANGLMCEVRSSYVHLM